MTGVNAIRTRNKGLRVVLHDKGNNRTRLSNILLEPEIILAPFGIFKAREDPRNCDELIHGRESEF